MSAAPITQRSAPPGKDYGYCNARIRGMKSRLFDQAYLERLMSAYDMQALIQDLMQTEYATDLEQAIIHGRTAAQVDEALKTNVVRVYRKVLGLLNGEAYDLVSTLLGRWDLFNLRSIVRGKHVQLSTEEILDGLIPIGQLSLVELQGLAASEDVRAVVDTAVTWNLPYAQALRDGFRLYLQSGELPQLEIALDSHYARWAAGRLSRRGANAELARRILGTQIDTVNLMTLFRLLKADLEGLDPAGFFLEGGLAIHRDLYAELAGMSDVDELLDKLRGTPYGKTLEEAAMAYLEGGSVAVFERELEELLTRRAVKCGLSDPLGVGVVIAYLWAKLNEVTNLRIIVKGKAVGMPDDRVRRELILV